MQSPAIRNLTRGNAAKNLWRFTVPFLLVYLLQALYGAVDVFVVGRFGNGSVSVVAVSNGGGIMMLILNLISGLTTGATVLIGRFVGENDSEKIRRTVGTALVSFCVYSLILTAFFLFALPYVLSFLHIPPEAQNEVYAYASVCIAGIFFITGYNAFSAIFRGLGNSVAPLIFVALACAFNIIGDMILVAGFHMGAFGAAIATVAGQALSMSFAAWYMKRVGFPLTRRLFCFDKDLAKELLKIGCPISVMGTLIDVSFMFITSVINTMGLTAAAGVGIVGRVNSFAMLPAVSAMGAIAAITAQNMGAKKTVRAVHTLKLGIAGTMAFGACAVVLLLSVPERVIGFFIEKNTVGGAETIKAGALYARSFCWDYLLVPIVFCTNGFFNGCGRSFFSMLNNVLCTFAVRIPVTYYFSAVVHASLYEVGFASPAASVASNVLALAYLASGRWRRKDVKWL